jgi:hypothetical protein
VARRAEELFELAGGDPDPPRLALHHLARHLAADLADLPFQPAHAGLAGVAADRLHQQFLGKIDLIALQPVRLQLLRQEVAPGDLDLLILSVTADIDDLHPVAQRARDRAERVGGADEEDAREVERQIEVMVHEIAVLLRVQHFQQRRGRIAALSDESLSISSSSTTGFFVPAVFSAWIRRPGNAPI